VFGGLGTPWATFLEGFAASAGPFGASASAMAARSPLPLLLTAVWVDSGNSFLRSVSLPICRPDLKAQISYSVGEAEDCLLGDGLKAESKACTTLVANLRFESGSGSSTTARPLRTLCLVFRMLLLVFSVLNLVTLFAAGADNLGWGPSGSDLSE